ncbi:MAG: response regulator [Caulobacterales bacterium]
MTAAFDPSGLVALVADENIYQRSVTADMLRMMGLGRVLHAQSGPEAWELILENNPNCIFTDWLSEPLDGLALIKRIRQSEEAPNRAANIFMLTARGAKADVETARLVGADGFLRKPISVSAIQTRLRAVVTQPRHFVVTASYVGPCRRRRQDPFYTGPLRRLSDQVDDSALDEDDEVKNELVKARITYLESQAMKLAPGDLNAARRVFAAARALSDVATEIQDAPLMHASSELVRYLETLGATSSLDFEALRTHISALHQLVHLPNAMGQERMRVAQSLTKMVDKKLRQAQSAA